MSSHDKRFWRSARDLGHDPALQEQRSHEFPYDLVQAANLNRRGFLGITGAAAAALAAAGCVRKPKEKILPFSKRPEDLIPGKPRFYATSALVGAGVLGLLVESQDGRPTKIEGNPKHPMSLGATNAWAQAEVMNLYDPDRTRHPLRQGKTATWKDFDQYASELLAAARQNQGQGLALLLTHHPSPTFASLLTSLQQTLPQARLYHHDACCCWNQVDGAKLVGLSGAHPLYEIDKARVLLMLDADPLGIEGDTVRQARAFAKGRKVQSPSDQMSRLYVVEPFMTITGGAADHRLSLPSSEVASFAYALVAELMARGVTLPNGAQSVLPAIQSASRQRYGKWIPALASDLLAQRGASLIMVGERQPPVVHALGHLLNSMLGNVETTVGFWQTQPFIESARLPELVAAIDRGEVQTLIIVGGNPVFDAPADLQLRDKLERVPVRIYHGPLANETAAVCQWHLPASHFLEAWGDFMATDGTASIQQPLIAPLYDTRSSLELLATLAGHPTRNGYELVRGYWQTHLKLSGDGFERRWRRWLHDGVIDETLAKPVTSPLVWEALGPAMQKEPASRDGLELVFAMGSSVYDGRYANNPWLQELPDPTSKLTWDNAACMSPATARALGVRSGDMVELTVQGRALTMAVFEVPGTAEQTVVASLGHGSIAGRYSRNHGFDTYRLRASDALYFGKGLTVRKTGATYALASTQEHGTMAGREIVREASLEQFRNNPAFAQTHAGPPIESLWERPNQLGGQQWGMSIDLNRCLGCNACVVACQAENNIPVVGKERVENGREMHWLRIDRYFTGSLDDPGMVVQPMACVHCENAPCESVCPVAATVHSSEGLNEMVYNRCIGTRYCSNNCPYKVRRFNFFNYNNEMPQEHRAQKNPDVTVRFRGIMEKCTYCVQRIQSAKISAKVQGSAAIADGAVITACQQACPTQAIVFGDINDPDSAVSRSRHQARDYAVLAELNTKPRTTYLARIRNPNPELV